VLVLSRKAGETIRLPGLDVEIEVVRIRGNRVQIGVRAPVEIEVWRGEIAAEATAENEIAVEAA